MAVKQRPIVVAIIIKNGGVGEAICITRPHLDVVGASVTLANAEITRCHTAGGDPLTRIRVRVLVPILVRPPRGLSVEERAAVRPYRVDTAQEVRTDRIFYAWIRFLGLRVDARVITTVIATQERRVSVFERATRKIAITVRILLDAWPKRVLEITSIAVVVLAIADIYLARVDGHVLVVAVGIKPLAVEGIATLRITVTVIVGLKILNFEVTVVVLTVTKLGRIGKDVVIVILAVESKGLELLWVQGDVCLIGDSKETIAVVINPISRMEARLSATGY